MHSRSKQCGRRHLSPVPPQCSASRNERTPNWTQTGVLHVYRAAVRRGVIILRSVKGKGINTSERGSSESSSNEFSSLGDKARRNGHFIAFDSIEVLLL